MPAARDPGCPLVARLVAAARRQSARQETWQGFKRAAFVAASHLGNVQFRRLEAASLPERKFQSRNKHPFDDPVLGAGDELFQAAPQRAGLDAEATGKVGCFQHCQSWTGKAAQYIGIGCHLCL
jgi:hypothetical protein